MKAKRLIAALLTVVTLMGAVPIVASATVYNDLVYEVWDDEYIVIVDYNGKGGSVVIPAYIEGLPVTEIADYAFSGYDKITSVTFSETLEYIGW